MEPPRRVGLEWGTHVRPVFVRYSSVRPDSRERRRPLRETPTNFCEMFEKVDSVSAVERSRIMALVRSEDTKPELAARRLLHALGYRYRLHGRDLPGKPDIVFRSRRKLIFVNGCFWHQHACKRGRRIPVSRRNYWLLKLRRNRDRDAVNQKRLRALGWSVFVIWECQLKNPGAVAQKLRRYLEGAGGVGENFSRG